MSSSYIDDKRLAIELADGFAVLTAEELKALYGKEYPQMWGTRDESRHAALIVMWKDSGGLVSRMADEMSLAKRAEKALSKSYRSTGYRFESFFATSVAKRDAVGFRYFYVPKGIPHECEVLVFKDHGRCYTLYYYTRTEAAEENRQTYEAMLASLELA